MYKKDAVYPELSSPVLASYVQQPTEVTRHITFILERTLHKDERNDTHCSIVKHMYEYVHIYIGKIVTFTQRDVQLVLRLSEYCQQNTISVYLANPQKNKSQKLLIEATCCIFSPNL